MRHRSPADADSVAAELYALPREEFTAARDARARDARTEGQAELAESIGRLRKPTMAAWLANLLSRERPEEVRRLVRLGESLRRAHREVAGESLRELTQRRHELVQAMVQETRSLGRAAGHPVSDAVADDLRAILTAALADPDAARVLLAGRLTSARDLETDAAGAWPAAGADAASPPAGGAGRERPQRQRAPSGRRRAAPAERQREERERQERERRERERARSEARDAEDALTRAQRAVDQADQEADEKRRTAEELRERLAAAERAVTEARQRARTARRDYQAAEHRARAAARRLRNLESPGG